MLTEANTQVAMLHVPTGAFNTVPVIKVVGGLVALWFASAVAQTFSCAELDAVKASMEVAFRTHHTVTHIILEEVHETLRVALAVTHCFWVAQLDASFVFLDKAGAALQTVVSVVVQLGSVAQFVANSIAYECGLAERLTALGCTFRSFRAKDAVSSIEVVHFIVAL